MQKKLELLKLKNLYTGEIVYTMDFDSLVVRDGQSFITVFKEESPNRFFLANREAYSKLTK
jgi:hypothetical protein